MTYLHSFSCKRRWTSTIIEVRVHGVRSSSQEVPAQGSILRVNLPSLPLYSSNANGITNATVSFAILARTSLQPITIAAEGAVCEVICRHIGLFFIFLAETQWIYINFVHAYIVSASSTAQLRKSVRRLCKYWYTLHVQ